MYKIGDKKNDWKAVLGFAPAKCGKSTFAFHAPQPIVVLNFDGGTPGIPPGIGTDIYIQNYPATQQDIDPKNAQWKRKGDVGKQMITDILAIRNTLTTDTDELILTDWETNEPFKMPRPKTVILDGLVQFNNELLNWLMASENYRDTHDAGAKKFQFWGMRLDRMNTLFKYILPLPCHKILNTWETKEMISLGGGESKPTGNIIPDIGGKMDQWSAGMVDASLYFFTENVGQGANASTKYYVCTKPTDKIKCIGVRGRYDLPASLDITINAQNPTNCWDRLWNYAQTKEKKLTK